jgi:DNA repair protein RecO (recombination protein O)
VTSAWGFARLEPHDTGKIRGFVPLHTADALVLRTYKLGEADRIVVFLTRDRGKKRCVAKGARRHRSRFVGALEPLTEVRVAYFESERRELVGLNYAETVRSPLSLVRPPATPSPDGAAHDTAGALGYVSYFAELLDEWAQDADADERLYRLGASMLDAFAAGAPVEPLVRYFEYWLLRLQGVYPEARGTLSAGAMAFLAGSRVVPPHQVGDVPVDTRVLRELEGVHRGLIATHLEKTLKSERVLRDLRRHG